MDGDKINKNNKLGFGVAGQQEDNNMNSTVRLIVDIFAIIVSAVGLAVLVINEKFLVSGFVLLLLSILIYYGFHLARLKPYQVKRVEYKYEFYDEAANLVKVSKTTVIVPQEKNVTKIEDVGITKDGKINSISTNSGTPTTNKKGGSISITTNFEMPLEIGKEYAHELSYQGENCFPDINENIIFPIISTMNEAKISIKFNEKKCR